MISEQVDKVASGQGLFSAALRNTAANQIWRLLSGPLVLLMVPVFISVDAQGYWYTFVSLGALTIFADLGFTAIVVQFTAHEFASLQFTADGLLRGDETARARLASLFRFAIRWSLTMSLVVIPVSLAVGLWLMGTSESNVPWRGPWLIYSLACAANFLLSVLIAFVEGCNRVADAHRLRLVVSLINFTCLAVLLVSGASLYALAVSLLLSVSFGIISLVLRFRPVVRELLHHAQAVGVSWRSELLPLLGRYAVSWVSGYLVLQLLPPLAFYFYGPAEAGKVGLSMAIWMSLFSLSNIWIVIITPSVNMLISSGRVDSLLPSFRKHLRLGLITFAAGAVVFLSLFGAFAYNQLVAERLLPLVSQLVLALGWSCQLLISSLAMFMRAHKEEPLMGVSMALAAQILLTTTALAFFVDVSYIVLGFSAGFLLWTPVVLRIYHGYVARYE